MLIRRRCFIGGAAALGLLARGPHAAASEPAPAFEGCFLRVAPERNFLELYNWSVTSGDQEADDVCRTAALARHGRRPDAIRAILAAVAVSREPAERAPPFAASPDISHLGAIGA